MFKIRVLAVFPLYGLSYAIPASISWSRIITWTSPWLLTSRAATPGRPTAPASFNHSYKAWTVWYIWNKMNKLVTFNKLTLRCTIFNIFTKNVLSLWISLTNQNESTSESLTELQVWILFSEMSIPKLNFFVSSITDWSFVLQQYTFECLFVINEQIPTWLFSKDMAVLAGITTGARPANTGAHTFSEYSHTVVLTWTAVTGALLFQIGLQCPL